MFNMQNPRKGQHKDCERLRYTGCGHLHGLHPRNVLDFYTFLMAEIYLFLTKYTVLYSVCQCIVTLRPVLFVFGRFDTGYVYRRGTWLDDDISHIEGLRQTRGATSERMATININTVLFTT